MATPVPRLNFRRSRRWLLVLFFLLLGLGAAAGGLYWWYVARYFQETDDAYVAGNVVGITAQITGIVRTVNVRDTDHVAAGHPLVVLDDADARIQLEAAEADLGQAVRGIRAVYANDNTLAADIAVRRADLAQAHTLQAKAEDDYATRLALVGSGAVGKEELKHAEAALAAAKATVLVAESAISAAAERAAANVALTQGTTIEAHPAVARAASRVREAYLAWARCQILAPVAGDIARRSVQVGQRVAPGTPLLAVVPLERVWVDANFKEIQLSKMRIGQPVSLYADVYGEEVVYQGHVAGFGAGSGAVFSLLPAQNATGNWIKIVQRVPVRIDLDAAQLKTHPLRVGLSIVARVDTHDTNGVPLGPARDDAHSTTTSVFDGQDKAAETRISEIVAAHRGPLAGRTPVASAQP